MAKKEITYQGLVDLNVQVEDISLSSPNYFRVSKLPSEFTAGKNVFRFKGNASLFAEGAPIYIEILDANGDPIYYETSLDLESAEQAAIVTVYINEDTAPGVAIIAICSTANYDIDGKILDTTQINVRWINQIYIDVSKRNEAEIIFDTLPEVTVFPSTGSYIVKTYFGNNKVAQLAFSSSKYYYRNDTPIVTGYIGTIGNGVAANYVIDPNSLEAATITFPISSLQNATPAALNTITTTQFTSSIDSFIYNTDILWFSLDQMYGDTWNPLTAKLLIAGAIPVNKTASDYLSVGQEVQLAVDTYYDYEIITARIVSINGNEITLDNTTSITDPLYQGTLLPSIGIKLAQPSTVDQTNGIEHIYSNASFSTNPTFTFEQLPNVSASTQNTNNLVTVYFNNLEPQTGTVSKIKSYYRSAGIGEYILSNETDISGQETEFGFNANVVTASFFLPTTQRNDKLDFKFEFVNPAGFVSKQVVESVNNTFLGGNTYIGGDDNLLTGSLYVAGSTGTGVHISGKGKSAMIRSIGYTGFQNATSGSIPVGRGGFVMYSGSIQPLLGSAESYSGVGLELVANSASYFKYATAGGGTLDIRTNSFFFGSPNSSYISSSNGAIAIFSNNFKLNTIGQVTASAILVNKVVASTAQTMIDTSNAILDATNLGRTLYHDPTEYTVQSASFSGFNTTGTYIGSTVFQGLKNEFKYTISYQNKMIISAAASAVVTKTTSLIASWSYANSGSNYDMTHFYTTNMSLNGTADGTYTKTFSEDLAEGSALELTNQVPFGGPNYTGYQGKLMRVDLYLRIGGPSGASGISTITGSIKNITITGTRGLGSSWGQELSEDPIGAGFA
jgi:hypothetical protein